jgi:hypothetical protein
VLFLPTVAPLKFRDNESGALVATEEFADILGLRVEVSYMLREGMVIIPESWDGPSSMPIER